MCKSYVTYGDIRYEVTRFKPTVSMTQQYVKYIHVRRYDHMLF